MPRTKGSKNRVTASTDFDAQIAKLQKDKAMLEGGDQADRKRNRKAGGQEGSRRSEGYRSC